MWVSKWGDKKSFGMSGICGKFFEIVIYIYMYIVGISSIFDTNVLSVTKTPGPEVLRVRAPRQQSHWKGG